MVIDNGDLKKLSREGGKKRGTADIYKLYIQDKVEGNSLSGMGMVIDNGDLKKLSREGGKKKRGTAERKMLLNVSDIKRGKAFGND